MINTPKFADLHVHTTFSDSTVTPEQLIREAAKAGLSAISIVDHDTIDGLEIGRRCGEPLGVEVVPGVELTSEYAAQEVHILGYFIDHTNNEFLSKLEFLRGNRIERVHKIVEKLKGLGINLEAQKVFDLAGSSTVGRPHVARAMVQEGLVKSTSVAFDKYLGDHGPAFVLNFRFSSDEAISLIKRAGGIPVLAHPYLLRSDKLIPQFIEMGIMGLEVYYPEHTQSMVDNYLKIAKKNNLLATGGSDYHGSAKPDVKLGMIKVSYELVEKLKEAGGRK